MRKYFLPFVAAALLSAVIALAGNGMQGGGLSGGGGVCGGTCSGDAGINGNLTVNNLSVLFDAGIGNNLAVGNNVTAGGTVTASSFTSTAGAGNPGFVCNTSGNTGCQFCLRSDCNVRLQQTGAGAGTFTGDLTLTAGTDLILNRSIIFGSAIVFSATAPTVSSGFGSGASITAGNATSFRLNVGTGGTAQNGVVGLPTASTGWNCTARDITTNASFVTDQTASSTSTATFQNYSRTTGLAIAWTASDILAISCAAF